MKERIITALCILLIVIPLLVIGDLPYKILIIAVSFIALYEFMKARGEYPITMKLLAYLYMALILLKNINDVNYYLDKSIFISAFLVFLIPIVYYQSKSIYGAKDAFYLLGGVLFLSTAFSFFVLIRNINLFLFIYLIIIACSTDTFAYFIGRRFGKNKMSPIISPKKTWEGAIGGTIFSLIISTIYFIFVVDNSKNIFLVILMGFLLSIIGQIGDLVFSAIKREYNIKDYSKLMPGHGGILDRVDSLILVVMAYALFHFII